MKLGPVFVESAVGGGDPIHPFQFFSICFSNLTQATTMKWSSGTAFFAFLMATIAQAGWLVAEENAEHRLQLMRERAQGTTVAVVGDGTDGNVKASLVAKPLFRYSDQPRQILDASFWCWQANGRPVAFQKVEFYDRPDENKRWFFCFASLSPGVIDAEWKAGAQWRAKKAGIVLKALPGAPSPAGSPARRKLQMKSMARRFSVRIEDEIAKTQQSLRLLTRPMHHYGSPNSDVLDGAVFGFAYGTNPDALLLVELHNETNSADKQWKFAWVQMTTGKLTASLDKKAVWQAPYCSPNANRPSTFDSWLFFYESVAEQVRR